jgi:hypothetical protein
MLWWCRPNWRKRGGDISDESSNCPKFWASEETIPLANTKLPCSNVLEASLYDFSSLRTVWKHSEKSRGTRGQWRRWRWFQKLVVHEGKLLTLILSLPFRPCYGISCAGFSTSEEARPSGIRRSGWWHDGEGVVGDGDREKRGAGVETSSSSLAAPARSWWRREGGLRRRGTDHGSDQMTKALVLKVMSPGEGWRDGPREWRERGKERHGREMEIKTWEGLQRSSLSQRGDESCVLIVVPSSQYQITALWSARYQFRHD